MRLLSAICFLLLCLYTKAQSVPNSSSLELKEIMKGNEYIGHQPEYIRWSNDGKLIYFEWNPKNEPGSKTYAYSISDKSKNISLADPKMIFEYDPIQYNYQHNYVNIEGFLIKEENKSTQRKVIYSNSSSIRNIQRTTNENSIYFQQGSNLYKYDAKNGAINQITNFVSGEEKKAVLDSTNLMKEEAELFEYLQIKKTASDWRAKNNESIYSFPKSFYLGSESIENIQISPNEKYVAFRLSSYPNEKETFVQHHIANDGHAYQSSARSKVGEKDPNHRLALLDISKDTIMIVDFSKLTDIRKKPDYLNDILPYNKDRNIIMHSLKFSKSTSNAVVDVRSYDNKDRWIALINLSTGQIIEIEHQHDEAWIGGPGISSWNMEEGTLGWLLDDETIFFQSEKTGYSHLYTYSLKTKKTDQLTSGNWEIHGVQLSHDGSHFYLSANRSHPGNRDFLKYEISNKKIIPVLTGDGYHEVSISPDEKMLAVRYSYKNKPWELYIAPNVINTKLTQITYSTTPSFNSYNWKDPKVLTFKGSDNIDVYARMYKPVDSLKNNAAVIFVHGAGYLQNAHNYWSTYYREYMFHNLLVDNGYTVLDIDYRASEGYGRDYRTAIYRHMGGRDLQDQIDGKRFLINEMDIDSTKVGIYGGSYGGFITLMGMLSSPGEFKCGAAIRSVTDWAHYNHEYTSNILNYPATDPEAYKKSSPIYYANGLTGKLLMLHGMVDDNVQFQDVVRLSQKFIELGKENWELDVYPVEAHGFKITSSWVDEYRRIYQLFNNTLLLNEKK